MKRIAVALVALLSIGTINSYAAFPTFVWTEEYRSKLYAVEMAADDGVDDTAATTDAQSITVSFVYDTVEDEPATSTDIEEKDPIPDEGMNVAGDDGEPASDTEEEPDSVAKIITSYDIELEVVEDGMEPAEEQQEDKENKDTQEENTEPKQEG